MPWPLLLSTDSSFHGIVFLFHAIDSTQWSFWGLSKSTEHRSTQSPYHWARQSVSLTTQKTCAVASLKNCLLMSLRWQEQYLPILPLKLCMRWDHLHFPQDKLGEIQNTTLFLFPSPKIPLYFLSWIRLEGGWSVGLQFPLYHGSSGPAHRMGMYFAAWSNSVHWLCLRHVLSPTFLCNNQPYHQVNPMLK